MTLAVDIQLARGAFVRDMALQARAPVTAIVGASGSGKSSLLHAIAGLVRPARGRIVLDGEVLFDSAARIDVAPDKRRVGLVFQDQRLFPHLTVRANLGYARRAPADEIAAMAGLMGIAALLDRWPRHLSGGEAGRVALARTLLAKPRLLLLDEPLAHLDADRRASLLDLIADVAADGVAMVYVTHDLREAERLGADIHAI